VNFRFGSAMNTSMPEDSIGSDLGVHQSGSGSLRLTLQRGARRRLASVRDVSGRVRDGDVRLVRDERVQLREARKSSKVSADEVRQM